MAAAGLREAGPRKLVLTRRGRALPRHRRRSRGSAGKEGRRPAASGELRAVQHERGYPVDKFIFDGASHGRGESLEPCGRRGAPLHTGREQGKSRRFQPVLCKKKSPFSFATLKTESITVDHRALGLPGIVRNRTTAGSSNSPLWSECPVRRANGHSSSKRQPNRREAPARRCEKPLRSPKLSNEEA